MRLIVMGQQAFGKDCLAKILEAGTDEVVAVYCEPDRDGKPVDPIKEFALEQGLAVHQPANFTDEDTLATLASHEADLMVMAFVNIFVPEAARDTPKMGSICFHPSLLPLHRGLDVVLGRALAFPVVLLAEHEHHHVGVLFDRSRFPQVRQLRALVLAGFDLTAEL